MTRPRLVRDILPGLGSSLPNEILDPLPQGIALGSNLFFVANNGTNGFELWRSDGSRTGTRQVADIDPGFDSAIDIGPPTAVGSTLFFSARDKTFDQELWKSDGTKSGTVRVADIWPGRFGSNPSWLTALGSNIFFTANDGGPSGLGGSRELWKSNGTAAGTVRITNFNQGLGNVNGLTVVSGTLFFVADDGVHGAELWKSDGTSRGTRLVKDINNFALDPGPSYLTAVGNSLFFVGEQNFQENLWKSDGTSTGTVRLTKFSDGSIKLKSLTAVGNTLFFVAGGELWKSNGTVSGTYQIKPLSLSGLNEGQWEPVFLTAVGNTVYFSADDGISGRELWKSDGTAGGTVQVADIEPLKLEGRFPMSSAPRSLKAVGNILYFSAGNLATGYELWKTDGTASGTVRVADINMVPRPVGISELSWFDSGLNGSFPESLTTVGRDLFYTADNGINGRELYFLDLTPPSLGSISLEGNRLTLKFSESIAFSGSIADRFAVTVDGASRSVSVSPGATSNELRLTLTGADPTSNQSVRVSYTDLTIGNDERGVIGDAEGNDLVSIGVPGRAADTFRSRGSVTALAATTTNLVLTGNRPINGTGNNLANTISGNDAANILNGGLAADRLIGGGGKDTLIGGLGADVFRFDSALSSTANRDTITDFNRFQGDRIELENAVFKGLTRTGTLAATAFRSGSNFNSPSQRILYNPATGNLSYDSNGNIAGGVNALIAILSTKPTLNNTMLIVT
jgi:ELWxxDGT repeat protein